METMILASALIPRFSITSVPSHVEVLEFVGHSQLKLAIDVASRSTVVSLSLSLSLTLSHSLTHSCYIYTYVASLRLVIIGNTIASKLNTPKY